MDESVTLNQLMITGEGLDAMHGYWCSTLLFVLEKAGGGGKIAESCPEFWTFSGPCLQGSPLHKPIVWPSVNVPLMD